MITFFFPCMFFYGNFYYALALFCDFPLCTGFCWNIYILKKSYNISMADRSQSVVKWLSFLKFSLFPTLPLNLEAFYAAWQFDVKAGQTKICRIIWYIYIPVLIITFMTATLLRRRARSICLTQTSSEKYWLYLIPERRDTYHSNNKI